MEAKISLMETEVLKKKKILLNKMRPKNADSKFKEKKGF